MATRVSTFIHHARLRTLLGMSARFRAGAPRLALALLIANEVRGLVTVLSILLWAHSHHLTFLELAQWTFHH